MIFYFFCRILFFKLGPSVKNALNFPLPINYLVISTLLNQKYEKIWFPLNLFSSKADLIMEHGTRFTRIRYPFECLLQILRRHYPRYAEEMRLYCGLILHRINTAIPPQYYRNTTAILPNIFQRDTEYVPKGIEIGSLYKKTGFGELTALYFIWKDVGS